jgi:hypothetical protein
MFSLLYLKRGGNAKKLFRFIRVRDSINIIGFIISTISLKIVKNNARLMEWEGKGRYAKILG